MTVSPTQKSLLTVISMIAVLSVMTSTIVTPALAIKRFFNCMTDVANKNGQLAIDDVNLCYDKEYHSGPFATSADSGSSTSSSK